jgi:transposase InsO family protein
MSKLQAIIVAVLVEGRTHADVAAQFGVSRSWVTRLVGRYQVVGDAAFEPRSRRPHTSPNRTPDETIELIIELRHALTAAGLDAGPETIRWHLNEHHNTAVSTSTIHRHLVAATLIKPEPRKRPKSSYIRFEADLPNETLQTDMTHVRLANGADVEVLTWLDDHARYALNVTAHRVVNTTIVVTEFTKTAGQHGYPASVLSDNGMYFTARFAGGGRTSRNRFETLLNDLGVNQKHSRPNHPTTCGKVERFQQTLKKWLRPKPPAASIGDLQTLLDEFVDEYNHRRPHRSLGRTTPRIAYTRLPKTGPTTAPETEHRIRRDKVDQSGKVTLRHNTHLYKIGIGRAHARTPIIMLITGLDIRIVDTQTGELLRRLTLNTDRTYQPTRKPRNPRT